MGPEQVEAMLGGMSGAWPDYPFGPGTQVWKVAGKMFAIVAEESDPLHISLKCDPDLALELRAQYPDAVTPGYHLNKVHWNTIRLDGTLDHELSDWIEHSYRLVLDKLPAKTRRSIEKELRAAGPPIGAGSQIGNSQEPDDRQERL